MSAPRIGVPYPLPRRPMRTQAAVSFVPRRATYYVTNGTARRCRCGLVTHTEIAGRCAGCGR